MHSGERRQFYWDFLSARPFKAVLRWQGFPLVLQIAVLAIFVLLTINGLGIGLDQSPEELMTLRKTSLTTLVVWGLWWPGMIALALALGRAWCTVCPMELVNRAGDELARSLGWPRLKLGRWLRAGWLIVVAYLVLQLLVAGFSIHRIPHYTALMLLVLIGAALATGLIFREPRSFCKILCPAAALLSVYGRYTPLQLDVRDPQVCSDCRTRDCVAQSYRHRFDHRSCPSLLRPFARQQSDACVLCLQCAKVCPYENIGLGLVKNTSGSRRQRMLRPYEAGFLIFAGGFVAHEVIGEVAWLDEYFHAVPKALQRLMPSVSFGWFEALWFLAVVPLILWMAASGLAYLFGHRQNLRSRLLAVATGAAPVVAIAHLAKAAAKITSWAGFLPLAAADPGGLQTLHQITGKALASPRPLVSFSLVGLIMLVLLSLFAWRSVRWIKEASNENLKAAYAGFAIMVVIYGSILSVWSWF
jgi:polyferredoxin